MRHLKDALISPMLINRDNIVHLQQLSIEQTMELQSGEFRLTRKIYFNIVMRKHLRKRIWFILMIWAFAIGLAFIRFNFITVILIVYGIVYPALVLYFLKKRVHAKTDPAIFRTRKLILKDGVLETHFADGTMSPVQADQIWRIYRKRKYSLAYTSKHQFIYIPREGFSSKAEYEIFIKSLLS